MATTTNILLRRTKRRMGTMAAAAAAAVAMVAPTASSSRMAIVAAACVAAPFFLQGGGGGVGVHGWTVAPPSPSVLPSLRRHQQQLLLLSTPAFSASLQKRMFVSSTALQSSSSSSSSSSTNANSSNSGGERGRLLVLGGTGFLGQTVCRRALLEGYSVTSLSRRGLPPPTATSSEATASPLAAGNIDYRTGDARQKESIAALLDEGGYVGVIHCIGLLFDDASGLGNFNRFVSGSGSLPDTDSTYDTITRLSAFNAIDATVDYLQKASAANSSSSTTSTSTATTSTTVVVPAAKDFPFVFTSAAEAGWPDMPGGPQIEQFLAPEWLRRYLQAKRAVEAKLLMECQPQSLLRPVIPRPSLIYSLDRPASYVPVGAFLVGNKIGLPFVDRPVTVQSMATAMVRSISQPSVSGILRYPQIDELSQ